MLTLRGGYVGLVSNPLPQSLIISVPAYIEVYRGTTLSISATVSNNSTITNLSYQWQKLDSSSVFVDVSGATSVTYAKSNAQPGDSGQYQLEVTYTQDSTSKVRLSGGVSVDVVEDGGNN
jgi:hypothetical protein